MKKRWLILAMAAVTAFALAGCKKTSDTAATTAAPAATEAPAATTAAPAETQAPATEAQADDNAPAVGEDEGDPDDMTAEALTAETVAE